MNSVPAIPYCGQSNLLLVISELSGMLSVDTSDDFYAQSNLAWLSAKGDGRSNGVII